MAKIELRRLSVAAGRELWAEGFDGCSFPSRSTKWFEVLEDSVIVGWCAYRYLPKKPGKTATLISEGVFVGKEHRGRNLQNSIREAMLAHVRAPGSRRPVTVRTYVQATNIASLRNCILWGLVPVKVWLENEFVFVNLEGVK